MTSSNLKIEIPSLIKQMPVFSNLSWFDRRFVAERSQLTSYKKGDIIYNEGDPPNAFYYIISGRIQIFTHDPNGKEITLEYIRRGEYFGIISLLIGDPHSVSTRVVNDTIILKIDKPDFDTILKRIPHLALHFSRSLSRRLKRKDLHAKTIFESTVISIYSPKPEMGCSWYAINFGLSMIKETKKKVILLDLSQSGTVLFNFLDTKGQSLEAKKGEVHFEEGRIKEHIYTHPLGLDILGISNITIDTSHVSHILSYLTNDYHYIIVDLPHQMNEIIFKALNQSDLVHLLFNSSPETLTGIKELLKKLEGFTEEARNKIKLLLVEEKGEVVSEKIEKYLDYDIYATLMGDGFLKKTLNEKIIHEPLLLTQPFSAYSRAVRRIAREIGDVLVGLALSSGAAYGLAHIGVIKVLEEEHIPVDLVIGSSIGALISAFWASGNNANEMQKIAMKHHTRWSMLKYLNFTFPRYGFMSGRGITKFLRAYLGKKTFHDVTLPVKIVTCDILTRERVVLEHGSLADAVRASISIPGIFRPVTIKNHFLVDGAVLSPVPVDVLTEMGINKIIAVNVIPSPEEVGIAKQKLYVQETQMLQNLKTKKPLKWLIFLLKRKIRRLFFPNIFDIIMHSMHAMEYILAEQSCKQADIVIRPTTPSANWFEFFNPEMLIKRGEEETRKVLPQIKALLYE